MERIDVDAIELKADSLHGLGLSLVGTIGGSLASLLLWLRVWLSGSIMVSPPHRLFNALDLLCSNLGYRANLRTGRLCRTLLHGTGLCSAELLCRLWERLFFMQDVRGGSLLSKPSELLRSEDIRSPSLLRACLSHTDLFRLR